MARNCINKVQLFQYVLIMLLLLQICLRDAILSLSDNNQADVIEAFNSTSRDQDDLLNIENPYFEIYPT